MMVGMKDKGSSDCQYVITMVDGDRYDYVGMGVTLTHEAYCGRNCIVMCPVGSFKVTAAALVRLHV